MSLLFYSSSGRQIEAERESSGRICEQRDGEDGCFVSVRLNFIILKYLLSDKNHGLNFNKV